MWNPEAGPPPDPLIHAIQESRAILQPSSAILSQEGDAAIYICYGTRTRARPKRWQTTRRRTLQAEPRQTRKAARTAHHSRRRREPQGWWRWRKGVHAESQGHGTRHAFATNMRAHPSLGDASRPALTRHAVSGRGTVDHTGLTQRTRAKSDAGAL